MKIKLMLLVLVGVLSACATTSKHEQQKRIEAHKGMEQYLIGHYAESQNTLEHVLNRTRSDRSMFGDDENRVYIDEDERSIWVQALARVYAETGEVAELERLVTLEMEGDVQARWECRLLEMNKQMVEASACYSTLSEHGEQLRTLRAALYKQR